MASFAQTDTPRPALNWRCTLFRQRQTWRTQPVASFANRSRIGGPCATGARARFLAEVHWPILSTEWFPRRDFLPTIVSDETTPLWHGAAPCSSRRGAQLAFASPHMPRPLGGSCSVVPNLAAQVLYFLCQVERFGNDLRSRWRSMLPAPICSLCFASRQG